MRWRCSSSPGEDRPGRRRTGAVGNEVMADAINPDELRLRRDVKHEQLQGSDLAGGHSGGTSCAGLKRLSIIAAM